MSKKIIQLKNIHKSYKMGETFYKVLKGISIDFEEHEFTAILGKSGSGKSTLMHIMGLLDNFDKGSYLLKGRDVSKLSENQKAELRGKEIGFVFQFFYLFPSFNAWENVAMPMLIRGYDIEEARERAYSLIGEVGLKGKEEHFPSQLSGGEQQRIAIARALILSPTILLADEPTGNLDVKSEKEILNIFKDINENFNTTIILVTHSLEVASWCGRTVYIKDGKIEEVVE